MANKSMLAIIAGIAVVAGVLSAYAIVGAGMKDNGNVGMVVNEEKRGKGTVDTLEFKNPVTIRLIDKDGNVASETVVYNAITNDGKEYIYKVLGDSSASATVDELNRIRFTGSGVGDNNEVFDDPGTGSEQVAVQNTMENCTPDFTTSGATCTATFTLDGDPSTPGAQHYTPTANGNLTLSNNVLIQTGHHDGTTFTPYFELNNMSVAVNSNTTYASIQITWQITVPP